MTVGLFISSPGSPWNTESLSVSSVFTVCWVRLNWDLNFSWSPYEGVLEFRWPDASLLSGHSLTCISVIRGTKKFPRRSMLRESRAVIFWGKTISKFNYNISQGPSVNSCSSLTVRHGTPHLYYMSSLKPSASSAIFILLHWSCFHLLLTFKWV